MAISKLVKSGQSFDRPSVSAFFGKAGPANDNLQKQSDMFSGGNFVSSITNMLQQLNGQLQKLQETSQKTILAFNKIIKDIRDVKKDIVSKFRIVNNELNSNKLDFVNGIRGGELPKPIVMPEPGTPVPANAPAAAAAPAPSGGGFDLFSSLSDLLGGASIVKDLIKWAPRIGMVLGSAAIVGLAGYATFEAFKKAMFNIAEIADWVEEKLGLKKLYKERMETQEYKDMQDTQTKITEDARKTNVDKGDRIKMMQKTLDDNKLQKKDVKTLQGDIITMIDGRQFDIKTQRPVGETPDTTAAAPAATPAATSPSAPTDNTQTPAAAPAASSGSPTPGGAAEDKKTPEAPAGGGSGGGGGGGGGSPAASAPATTPAAPADGGGGGGGGGSPAASAPATTPTAPAATPSAPSSSAPMPTPAPAAPSTGTGGVGSIQAPGAGSPTQATPTPAANTATPPTGTPTPTARPTGDELKALGGIERTTPAEQAQQQAQQNTAAIQNPMALMAAKMEAAKQIDENKPKAAEANTFVKGQEPVYTAMGDLAMPGTPDQKFVGSGRGSVIEGLNERANAQAVGSGRGSVIEAPGARAAANTPKPKPAAPVATAPVVDPHAKSKALFQEVLDIEKQGGNSTAKYFEADKQRMAELAAIKDKPASGAPAPAKKAEPKKQKEMSAMDKMRMGRGAGDHTAPMGLGDESAGYTGAAGDILQAGLDQQAALNAGPEPGYSGKAGGVLQTNLNDMAVVEAEQQKERAAAAQKMQSIDDADMARAPGEKAKLAQMSEQKAMVEAGASPAVAGMRAGPKAIGAAIRGGPEASAEKDAAARMQAIDDADMARAPGDKEKLAVMSEQQAKIDAGATPAQAGVRNVKGAGRIIGPKPADLEPPRKLSEQSGGEPIVQNNNQTQNSGTTSGGEGNNVSGQNLPMKATNDWLKDFIERQQIAYQ
jgi:hypothetical protein